MKNKKLNLRKITITKLNNLHHIKGGHIPGLIDVLPVNTGDTCDNWTCPTETKTNPDNEDITDICQQ
ncbi:hypothetical protein [Aquimarina sp. 2304DJ70-9]|uniref:hypothetical protein n=1 Tax=Aquimarina penaris TaxID=3231044 RepID=UPI003461ED4F